MSIISCIGISCYAHIMNEFITRIDQRINIRPPNEGYATFRNKALYIVFLRLAFTIPYILLHLHEFSLMSNLLKLAQDHPTLNIQFRLLQFQLRTLLLDL